MCEGYDPLRRNEPIVPGLDEYLCEYVDGTMDSLVREVFEEYLSANPDVAAHAERLREARSMLCSYGCRCQAPRGLHAKLRRRLAAESVGEVIRVPYPAAFQLNTFAVFASAVAVALLLGLTVGSALEPVASGTPVATVQSAPSRPPMPSLLGARALYQPALAGASSAGHFWRTPVLADSQALASAPRMQSFRAVP